MTRYIIVSQENDAVVPCQAGRLHIQSAHVLTKLGQATTQMNLKALLAAGENGDEFAVEVHRDADTEQIEWHKANIVACSCGEANQHVVKLLPTVIANLNDWTQAQ